MRNFFTALGVALVLFISQPANAQVGVIEADPFDVIEANAITSTVTLFAVNDSRRYTTCTGVVIKNTPTESVVLTAQHCVGMKSAIYVEEFLVSSVGIDPYNDLAYVKVNDFIPYKTPAKLSNYIPVVNDKIIIIGYPDMKLYKARGVIKIETSNEYVARIRVIGGCSGGGTFNERGELIGIVTSNLMGTKTTFIQKLQNLHKFVNVNKLLEK